ncbi:MAG: hypothetical protein OSJ60_06515 [Lachnospiraceae bacterium]|nr:hypothetical protein [Lachnospiraceae bacterium]
MDKIILYGAGNYCDKYIFSEGINYGEISGIIDSAPEKWNTLKNGYNICSPDLLDSCEYGKVILTVSNPDAIIDKLLHKNISISKIFIYDAVDRKVLPLSLIYDDYVNRKIFRKNAVRQVKLELLMETFREKEYANIERVVVIGTDSDYELVKEFFETLNLDILVLLGDNSETFDVRETDKYLFSSKDYKNDLKKFREKFLSENQWLIIPLFDVEDTIKINI